MAYKPEGFHSRGDLVRVCRGNVGFFAFVFFIPVPCSVPAESPFAREDIGTNEGTNVGINGSMKRGTNKKKQTMEGTNTETDEQMN